MALVNPNIAMSYRPTTEYQPRNALAEYAQIQQIVGGQRQAEVADMQLESLRRDRDALSQIQAAIVAKGGPPDLGAAADAMMKSGRPEYVDRGMAIHDSLRNQRMFEAAIQRFGYAEVTPAAAAPSAAAAAAPAAAEPTAPAAGYQSGMAPLAFTASTPPRARQPIVGLKGELLGYEPEAPAAAPVAAPAATNALAAPVAAPTATNALAGPAAAPVATNALAAAPAGKTADQLRQEILAFSSSTDPRAKAMVDVLKTQLAELTKTHTVGGQIVSGAGRVVYTAPSQIAMIESEVDRLRKDGVKDTDPRIAARLGKIAQLSGAGTPLDITRAMAERDRLVNAGRSLTDPNVQALNNYIRKQSTHAPGTSVTVTQEKAERGKFGELLVKQFEDISRAAGLAAKTLPALDTQSKILDQGFTTGFGTDVKAAGASVLAALGVPEAEKFATDAQTFLAATQQAVLQRQLEQKGPQTEADAQRITQTAAQRGNTVNANRFLIDVARAQLKRDIEQRNFYAEWRRGPGQNSFDGAEDAWFAGPGGKSLFDRPELKKYLAPAQGATTAPAAGSVRTQADAILQRK